MNDKKITGWIGVILFAVMQIPIVFSSIQLVILLNPPFQNIKSAMFTIVVLFNFILGMLLIVVYEYAITPNIPQVDKNKEKREKIIEEVKIKQFNPAKTVMNEFDKQD